MATIKKAQKGTVVKKAAPTPKPAAKKAIPGPYSDERVKALDAASVYGKGKKTAPGYRNGGVAKAKDSKGFPDLNKDGKVTKADVLKGRGVIAKKGAKVMPCASCGKSMKKK